MDNLFKKVEMFNIPSTILFRSIELKLLDKTLKKYVVGKKRILDLGCGEGIVAGVLFDTPLSYGLDTDREALEQAKKRGIYKHVLQADATTIPLPDNSIDFVFSNSVLEHIPHLHGVLKEVSRVLKPNGLFIFTTISDQFASCTLLPVPALNTWWGKMRNRKFQHYHTYSLNHWVKLLLLYDFSYQDGYYYISPKTMTIWEILLFLFYVPLRINRNISHALYLLLRKRIYALYKTESMNAETGAALCIIARKK